MKRKKIVATMAALLAVCLVLGAGGLWFLNREQQPRLDVISRKDALEDYDYLWETLEENYPFFGVAERKYGLDIQQMKQDYRQQLEGMEKEIDFLEFYQLMKDCVGEFGQLGHLILYPPDTYWTEIGDVEHLLGNIDNEFFTTLLDYRYQNFYDLAEVRERYGFLREKLDVPEKETQNKAESNLILEQMSDKIAYMKIKSFAGENLGEEPKQEIADFLLENADAPYLIIDVCGNGGGYSNYWSDYIVIPNIIEGKTAPYFYVTPYGENSREEMKMNGQEASQMNDQLDALCQLPKINQDDLLNVRYYGKGAYTFQPQLDEKVYKGQIFLLIDRKSSSSADAFAYFCKGSGFATVLGQENACGSGPGGNHVIDQLPHSNLLFRYRPVLALDMEGAALEEFGVAPDVLLPSRAKNSNDKISPLAACLNYIEELEERKD